MTYVVRSRSGHILRRCATRSEAERYLRDLRSARSPSDLGEVARIRVREPLMQERIQVTEPVQVNTAGFPEVWALVVTRGKAPPYGILDAGRILVVLPDSNSLSSDPLAGLVWVKEHGKLYVHQVWVDPEAQRRGVSRLLLDAYRRHVARSLLMKGPFSAAGEALAKAARAKILRSPSKSNWVGRQRSLDRYSIEELFALRKTIENAPGARRPTDAMGRTPWIYIFTPKTRKKLDDIDWAITSKLKELRAGKI